MPQNNYRISFDLDIWYVKRRALWGELFEFVSYPGGLTPNRFHDKQAGDRLQWMINAENTWMELKWEIRTPTTGYVLVKIPGYVNGDQTRRIDLKLINNIATIWVDGVVANGVGKDMGPTAKSTVTSSLYMSSSTDESMPAGEIVVDNFKVFRL